MDLSTESTESRTFSWTLAGLEAGTIAVLWMLAWLGANAVLQGRSFWTAGNVLATVFYGSGALRNGFSTRTLSGVALYLLVYGALGGLFAVVLRGKLRARWLLLAGIVTALVWYYLSYRIIWRSFSPLVPLLHSVRPTILGHVIYGALLARFPGYMPHASLPPQGLPESIETPPPEQAHTLE